MRFYLIFGTICAALCSATLHAASILPTFHFDNATLQVFQQYVADFERKDLAAFNATGKFWIDDEGGVSKAAFEAGKTVVEPRENQDVASGSIHHFTGVIHVPGVTIEALRRVMQDYPAYPKNFGPDVASASGEAMPDNTPADEHFHTHLLLKQTTLWVNVTYQTLYDVHYIRLDPNRWVARSTSLSVKELLNPANPNGGTYPEGDDHGFLWKTNTYWFARQRNGGLDIETNSITVSRPIPTGFGWWGTKRTREAVEKMLTDSKTAISSR